jgi:PAB1-binding protein PBP1
VDRQAALEVQAVQVDQIIQVVQKGLKDQKTHQATQAADQAVKVSQVLQTQAIQSEDHLVAVESFEYLQEDVVLVHQFVVGTSIATRTQDVAHTMKIQEL